MHSPSKSARARVINSLRLHKRFSPDLTPRDGASAHVRVVGVVRVIIRVRARQISFWPAFVSLSLLFFLRKSPGGPVDESDACELPKGPSVPCDASPSCASPFCAPSYLSSFDLSYPSSCASFPPSSFSSCPAHGGVVSSCVAANEKTCAKRECYASLSESLEAASLSSPASSGTASCGSSARLRFADDSEAAADMVAETASQGRRPLKSRFRRSSALPLPTA